MKDSITLVEQLTKEQNGDTVPDDWVTTRVRIFIATGQIMNAY